MGRKAKKIGPKRKQGNRNNLFTPWKTHNDHNYCIYPNSVAAINHPCQTLVEDCTTDEVDNLSPEASYQQDWNLAMTKFQDKVHSSPFKEQPEVMDSDGVSEEEFYVILDRPYMYDPEQDLDELVCKITREKQIQRFAALRRSIQDNYNSFPNYSISNQQESIIPMQLYASEIPTVKWSITINSTCQISLFLFIVGAFLRIMTFG